MSTSTSQDSDAESGVVCAKSRRPEDSNSADKKQSASVPVETPLRPRSSNRARFQTSSTAVNSAECSDRIWLKERHKSTLPPLPSPKITAQQQRTYAFLRVLRGLLPCVISVFIGGIFIVNKHIAFLSGTAEFAFLIIVIYTLFFHPAKHTVGKHIQATGK